MNKNTFSGLISLTRFDKPIGIFLLLWPTWWALWFAAQGLPSFKLLVIFTLGVIVMRAAGCVINDFADRHIDGHISRTNQRPLVSGKITPKQALLTFILLCLLAFLLVLFLNKTTILLAPLALALGIIYPFMKRYTHFPQLILGMAWYFGIFMAYTATLATVNMSAYLLYAAAVVWTLIYDTMYAMVDREEDIKIGVKSTAILFGSYECKIILSLQILMLGLLSLLGYLHHLSWPYYTGLFAAAAFFAYQQRLISSRLPADCFAAFLNNYWVGLSIFVGLFFALPH